MHVEDRQRHRPGQHYLIRLRAPDDYTAQRSYSVASHDDDPLVEFLVERLPGGEVSEFLADVAEVGDVLELRGPIGRWFLWDTRTPALCLVAGTGVVPAVATRSPRRSATSSRRCAPRTGRRSRTSGLRFNLHAIIGGQLADDDEPALFLVYPEGNWVDGDRRLAVVHHRAHVLRQADPRPAAARRHAAAAGRRAGLPGVRRHPGQRRRRRVPDRRRRAGPTASSASSASTPTTSPPPTTSGTQRLQDALAGAAARVDGGAPARAGGGR